jgi:hypothetical protein
VERVILNALENHAAWLLNICAYGDSLPSSLEKPITSAGIILARFANEP